MLYTAHDSPFSVPTFQNTFIFSEQLVKLIPLHLLQYKMSNSLWHNCKYIHHFVIFFMSLDVFPHMGWYERTQSLILMGESKQYYFDRRLCSIWSCYMCSFCTWFCRTILVSTLFNTSVHGSRIQPFLERLGLTFMSSSTAAFCKRTRHFFSISFNSWLNKFLCCSSGGKERIRVHVCVCLSLLVSTGN